MKVVSLRGALAIVLALTVLHAQPLKAEEREPCQNPVFAPHEGSLCELLEAVDHQKDIARERTTAAYRTLTWYQMAALTLGSLATLLLGLSDSRLAMAGRVCTALATIASGAVMVFGMPRWLDLHQSLEMELAALESRLDVSVALAAETQSAQLNYQENILTLDSFIRLGHTELSQILARAGEAARQHKG